MTDLSATDALGTSESASRSKRPVPAWLENLAALGWRVLVIVALVVVVAYLGSLIWNVVAAIGLAIIVAVVMAPFVIKMRDGGRSRSSAAGSPGSWPSASAWACWSWSPSRCLPYAVDILQGLQAGQ